MRMRSACPHEPDAPSREIGLRRWVCRIVQSRRFRAGISYKSSRLDVATVFVCFTSGISKLTRDRVMKRCHAQSYKGSERL